MGIRPDISQILDLLKCRGSTIFHKIKDFGKIGKPQTFRTCPPKFVDLARIELAHPGCKPGTLPLCYRPLFQKYFSQFIDISRPHNNSYIAFLQVFF